MLGSCPSSAGDSRTFTKEARLGARNFGARKGLGNDALKLDRDLRQRQEGEQQVSFGPVRQQREMRRGGRPGAPRPRGPRGLAPQRLRQCSRVAAVTITNQAY